MNVFRLVLCFAGLATFLLVRQFAEPVAGVPQDLTAGNEGSLQLAAEFNSSWSDGDAFRADAPRVLLSPVEIDRFELDGKTVIVAESLDGVVYRVTDPKGKVLVRDLNGVQLRALDPELHSRILAALVPRGGRVMGVGAR